MRKIQFILGILAAASSSATLAYDGTITFNGKVVDQTCSVTTGSKNLTVTLPTVSSNSLTSNGEVAGLTPFTISLEGCTSPASAGAENVKAYFEPNATTDYDSHNLNIASGSGNATNVQIQLLNADGTTPILLGTDSAGQAVTPVAINGTNVTLRYNAQYYATGQATAGNVSATVNYTIAYQ
ncbi:F17A fimbrial adhesin [Escherichia coli]|uniref:F17A fimbrial adhesin n=1 Tax=Escherichia coli TaxID=562 RepID=UPI000BE41413|nr:F17A fimbrial adhesin [Escherichia coli]EFC2172053.1 F17A fimbrial adhesin [Escherichia coli]EFC3039994.1 F17A fimbrial adhesin [Escherichia coli]EFD5023802.1 F17A fimbrial adhesin [Escherichia coli]EFD5038050.1 F17A fimbrial adhesin [Escherichia coli]EFE6091700.1 F17A fimbrial adhesin [Escherichia coli]